MAKGSMQQQQTDSAMQRNAKCTALVSCRGTPVKRNAGKSFAVVGEKNLFFLLLSIDGFPPPPFSRHIG